MKQSHMRVRRHHFPIIEPFERDETTMRAHVHVLLREEIRSVLQLPNSFANNGSVGRLGLVPLLSLTCP